MHRSLLLGLLLALLPAAPLWADPKPDKLIVATWNLEWFYDNYTADNFATLAKEQAAPSREEWDWKIDLVAKSIAQMKPTILALQEIENQRVLFYLTRKLKNDHGLEYKIAFVEGTDYFTEQDVGILYQSGLVEMTRREMSKEMSASKLYYGLQKHIITRFEWGTGDDLEQLTLMNVHFRAQPNGGNLRAKQSKLVRHWLNDRIAKGENVIVIGDVNTEEPFDETTNEGDVGVLRGLDTPSPDDDLADLHVHLPKDERVTHIIGKQFDRILVSKSLTVNDPQKTDLVFKSMQRRKDLAVRGKEQDKDHWNIYYTIPQDERDVSDHFPLVAEFEFLK